MTAQQIVETRTFNDIARAMRLAIDFTDNAAIIGAAGTGKTTALKTLTERTPGAVYVELTEQSGRSVRGLLLFICQQLGIESAGATYETERRVYRWLPPGSVLIIDEAQHMPPNVLRSALNFNDLGKTPVVLCGNDNTLRPGREGLATFAQIDLRIGPRVHITATTDEDADKITNTFDVEGLDAYAITRSIGAKYHARGIARVLTQARRFAGERKTIKAQHIRDAIELFPQYRPAIARR